jgi:hypothetical protein
LPVPQPTFIQAGEKDCSAESTHFLLLPESRKRFRRTGF